MTSIFLLRSRSSTLFIHLTDDSLSIGRCRHEVWLGLDTYWSVAVGTVTVRSVHLPNVLSVVIVVTRVVGLSMRMVVDVGCGALAREPLVRIVAKGAIEPVTVKLAVTRGSRGRVLGGTITGIRWCEWSVRPGPCGVLVPRNLVRAVCRLLLNLFVALEARKAFVLSNLLLAPDLVGLILIGLAGRANEVGLYGCDQGCDPLAIGHRLSNLLAVHPVAPTVQPCIVILTALQINVEVPVNATEPFSLKLIQLRYRDAGHFGPGAVLKSVVIEEFAAEQEGDGQHAPDLSFVRMEGAQLLQAVDSLRQIVHSEEDRSLGQACGCQDLRDKLAKGSGNVQSGGDQLDRHLGYVLGHHVDFIVEDSADTATRHFGEWM